MRRDDAGIRTARLFLRDSLGNLVFATTETLNSAYVGYNYLYPINPFPGGGTWSSSIYNGVEIGAEMVA